MAESRDMTMATTVTLLGAAYWTYEGIDSEDPMMLEELAGRVGMTPTTVSQHLRYLGDRQRIGRPGLGLVVTDINPDNRRKKVFRLTLKGRLLIHQLDMILRKVG